MQARVITIAAGELQENSCREAFGVRYVSEFANARCKVQLQQLQRESKIRLIAQPSRYLSGRRETRRCRTPQNIRRFLQGNAEHEIAVAYAKDTLNGLEVSRWHERAARLAENPQPKQIFAIQPRAGALAAAYTPMPW